MILYVIRHGKAEPDSPSGLDRDRPLRERGLRQARFLGETLAACDEPPRRIVSSPFVRARDTALAIAGVLALEVEFDTRLEVDEPVGPVLELIKACMASSAVAIVGHNPQLERLISFLLNGPGSVVVRTGEAFALSLDAPERASATLIGSWRLD